MSDHVIIALSIAFLMALLMGTPSWFPHPGRFISWSARRLYPVFRSGGPSLRFWGVLYISAVALGTLIVAEALLESVALVSYEAFLILSVLFVYTSLLPTNLFQWCEQVRGMLDRGERQEVRRQLSGVVGADVGEMKDEEAARMAIEVTAEKSVTDVVSPMFFALIGGPAFAIAYRALSACHETVRRREPPYGPFVAMTESLLYILDFVPSRVVLFLTIFAAWFNRHNVARCWLCVQRDGGIHLNPNFGLIKAAYAGTLGIQLGGTNFFYGGTSTMPPIGEPTRRVESSDVKHSLHLILTTSVAAFFCGVAARVLVLGIFSLMFQSCKSEVVAPTPAVVEEKDVTGSWAGTWESPSIPEAKGTMDCAIAKEGGRWKLVGTITAAGGTVTQSLELWGKAEKDQVKFEGRTDFGKHGKYQWEILCSGDSLRGTFKGESDTGSFALQKK